VHVVEAEGMAVPVQCQHCEDPLCAAVCPTEALYKDEAGGPVRLAVDKCVGCRACVIACPFGAIDLDEAEGKAVKCDLCEGIVQAGEEPRCVAACPTRALQAVPLGESRAGRREQGARRAIEVLGADDEEGESQ
jgi:anaerobic dimethyl sulfoxide reductase subunit B (iron-sulfur subunit)